MMLYKYRSLENKDSWEHFIDIIRNNRLYAATYPKLNDDKEGHYIVKGEIDTWMRDKIKDVKQEIRICSLSKEKDIAEMWELYADKHRGVVIEVEITNTNYTPCPICYNKTLYSLSYYVERYTDDKEIAKDILSHKLKKWEKEKEQRIFTENEEYIYIKITKIITGKKISDENYRVIKQMVKKINPSIKVKKSKDVQ